MHVQMEDELSALGERWAHICKWAEEYGVKLQTLLMKCSRITEQLSWLQSWFDSKEVSLKHMESKHVTEVAEILERIKQLQVIFIYRLWLLNIFIYIIFFYRLYAIKCQVNKKILIIFKPKFRIWKKNFYT